MHESRLSPEEQQAFGAIVGALIGLGAAGEESFELGAERGADAVEEPAWDVLAEIPRTPLPR